MQVGLQLNPVRPAMAEFGDLDSKWLQDIAINTETTANWLSAIYYELDGS
jgi:hypothetical protein